MRWGRRSVLARHESRAGGLRGLGWFAAIAGFLLALIVGGALPRDGSAGTIPSIPSVSVPSVSVPKVTVPTTVSVPTVSVPTVTVPKVTVPTVTVPKVTVPTVTTPPPVHTPTVPTLSVPKKSPLPVHTPTAPASSRPSTQTPSAGSHSPAAGTGSGSTAASSGVVSAPGGSSGTGSTTGSSGSAGGADRSFAGAFAGDGAGAAIARPPRGQLSQQYLRRVISKLKGCLSSLPAHQSEILVLRTGTGLRRSYTRAQVARILHVTVAQEGRLEHQAVTGLGKAAVGSTCASPARSLQRAAQLATRAVLNFVHTLSSPERARRRCASVRPRLAAAPAAQA